MNRRQFLLRSATAAATSLLCSMAWAATPTLTLHKDPGCTCCEGHAKHLQQNGFRVDIVESLDLNAFRLEHGIPQNLVGCHTILVDGYIVEGHVPAQAVSKLLSERPAIRGISLPGMPLGSPGMDGAKEGPLVVLEIQDGLMPRVFWRE